MIRAIKEHANKEALAKCGALMTKLFAGATAFAFVARENCVLAMNQLTEEVLIYKHREPGTIKECNSCTEK